MGIRKDHFIRLTAVLTALCMTGCAAVSPEPETSLPVPTAETAAETSPAPTVPSETETSVPSEAPTETQAETEDTTEAATEAVTETVPETTEAPDIPAESISLSFYEVTLYTGDSAMPIVTMQPENVTDRTEIWSTSDNSVASIDYRGNITANAPGSCVISVAAASAPEVIAEVSVTVVERPQTDPPPTEAPKPEPELTYIGGILIANKTYALPSTYNPGLDATCKAQFDLLAAAAASEGLNIWLASGYRSYERQATIYQNYLNWYGQEKTDTLSARPGHSEHQTGLAIDVNSVTDSFANTPEAAWLAEHAHEYGFIIRYPKGKEHITGYKYEPWHIRYLGVETATAVYNSGLCLEEYLGITSCYAE